MIYATDPTTLRSEARDIEIGAPDGDGYAGWLRACADRIEFLEALIADADLPIVTSNFRTADRPEHDPTKSRHNWGNSENPAEIAK